MMTSRIWAAVMSDPALLDRTHRALSESDSPRTSIIVPAYNEEAGLGRVLERIVSITSSAYEIIVVDDGSTDETAAIAARYPCRLLRHKKNEGKGRALRSGIAAARGEYVVVLDSDDTYPVETIPRLVAALGTHDVVSGSRMGKLAIPPMNRVGNWLLRSAIRMLYGSAVTDPLTGFYAARKRLLREMRLSSDGFG